MHYVVLDYDGFICKSFFAAHRDESQALEILTDLTFTAIDKAREYFKNENTRSFLIASGHSWKKDLYSDYKQSREKDPYVGAYRDYVIEEFADVIKPETLEADELCVMIHDYAVENSESSIIFSDDKDLKYSSLITCGINLTEKIDINYIETNLYKQMLAGDKEDDIKGIPKVGMKTAEKLLDDNGFNIEGVIKTYKDKGISKEECTKNLNLIIPMKREFNTKPMIYNEICRKLIFTGKLDEASIHYIQNGQLEYLTRKVNEIYG